MVSKSIRKWIALGLVGAAMPIASALGQGAAQEAAPPAAVPPAAVPLKLSLRVPPDGEAEHVLTLFADGAQGLVARADEPASEGAPPSEYYIGIALGELPEVAKKQLKLEYGLVVDDVLPNSPAAKAEFKPLDVLVRAGELKLEHPADILKAVDESKDKEMHIIVLRDGKEMTLKVTPSKRPKPEAGNEEKIERTLEARVPSSAIQRIEEALRELKGNDGPARALELYFPRAGVVAPEHAADNQAELPKNLKISITREGDGPAKIHVEREGKSWDTTDDKLGELPEDVRGQVERMLSKVMHPMLATRVRSLVVPKIAHAYSPGTPGVPAVVPAPAAPGTPAVPALPAVPGTPSATARLHAYRVTEGQGGNLEAKLDQILKKLSAGDQDRALDKLRDEVERLRKEVDALKNK